MTQLLNVFDTNDHNIDIEAQTVALALVKSFAVSLFAAQVSGLIKFPAGGDEGLTVGEIESKLDLAAAAFVQKLIESKP